MKREQTKEVKIDIHFDEWAEQAALGSILTDLSLQLQKQKIAMLKPHFFYLDKHKAIFKGMQELSEKDTHSDLITVQDHLGDKNPDGLAFLAELATCPPSNSELSFRGYANIVKKKYRLRLFQNFALKVAEAPKDDPAYIETASAETEALLEEIRETSPDANNPVAITTFFQELIEEVDAVATGFSKLDAILDGGFQKGDLIIIGGRPGMGKTALAIQMALNMVIKNLSNVLFVSIEMRSKQIAQRILNNLTLATETKETLTLPRNERNEIKLEEMPKDDVAKLFQHFLIQDTALVVADIKTQVALSNKLFREKLKPENEDKQALDVVFIDHLHLMSGEKDNGGRKDNEIAEITRDLKALAKKENIVIILLAQMNRSVETTKERIPQMSHLRESGEEQADIVLMPYRDEYYEPEMTPKPGILDLYIRKNRHGGTGELELKCDMSKTKFAEAGEVFEKNSTPISQSTSHQRRV